jgi:excisionase family DNA binding protein
MRNIGTTEAAERLGVTERRVRQLCAGGRIRGAYLIGKTWIIPVRNDGLPDVIPARRGRPLKRQT